MFLGIENLGVRFKSKPRGYFEWLRIMLSLLCVLGLSDPRPCGIELRNTWTRSLEFGKGILYDTHIIVFVCLILLEG